MTRTIASALLCLGIGACTQITYDDPTLPAPPTPICPASGGAGSVPFDLSTRHVVGVGFRTGDPPLMKLVVDLENGELGGLFLCTRAGLRFPVPGYAALSDQELAEGVGLFDLRPDRPLGTIAGTLADGIDLVHVSGRTEPLWRPTAPRPLRLRIDYATLIAEQPLSLVTGWLAVSDFNAELGRIDSDLTNSPTFSSHDRAEAVLQAALLGGMNGAATGAFAGSFVGPSRPKAVTSIDFSMGRVDRWLIESNPTNALIEGLNPGSPPYTPTELRTASDADIGALTLVHAGYKPCPASRFQQSVTWRWGRSYRLLSCTLEPLPDPTSPPP
ncbi:hypothetical protein [Zavarzinia sp.]|uniref:hypothetical protein n=1 Tax=Zavarzinia sp. TaxID=2027920 RepID=UPI003563C41A